MKSIYYFCMYFMFILVFLNEIVSLPDKVFIFLSSIGLLVLLLSSIYMIRGFQFYVSLLSLIVGHILLFSYDLSFEIWYQSLVKNLGIPILFLVIPLISFPIKHGKYLPSIEAFIATKRKKPSFLFALLSIFHLSLTIPLNIGSIPIQQKLVEKIQLPKKFLVRMYTAGYSSYMVFSPYDPVVNMVLLWTGISFFDYFFSGFIMVIIIIVVSSLLVKFDQRLLKDLSTRISEIQSTNTIKKAYELLAHIAALIVLAFLGVRFIPFSNQLYIIAVMIIGYALFWGAQLKELNNFKKEIHKYNNHILAYKTIIPFLISSSFLASIVSYSPLKEYMGNIFVYLNQYPLYLIILLLILTTAILSLVGVHMMITIPALALTVAPDVIGLGSPAYALTLLTCWYIAMSISPFVPFAVVVGETIGEKPTHVTFKDNLFFTLLMLFVAPIIIVMIHYLTLIIN